MAWKWGLQSNLPVGHTYKTSAPVPVVVPSPIFLLDFTSSTAPTAPTIGAGTYPLTVRGTPSIVTDSTAGNVLAGSSGFYSVPALIINSPWTMTFWQKVTGANGNYVIMVSSSLAKFYPQVLIAASPMNLDCVQNPATAVSLTGVYLNKWHFISIVFTGSTTQIFVDGVGSSIMSVSTQLSSAVNIGAYSTDNNNAQFNTGGFMYNFQMFNVALSSDQINTLMASTKRIGT